MTFALREDDVPVHLRGDALGRSYTPRDCARAIVHRLGALQIDAPGHGLNQPTVLEPCVGGGAFVEAARELLGASRTVGVDVDPDAPGLGLCNKAVVDDFLRADFEGAQFNLAITNPPFGKVVGQDVTTAIVAKARRLSAVCAIVMPADYTTQAGFEVAVSECSEIWPLLPRPFPHERGMAVYVWGTRARGRGTLHRPLRWRSS